MTVVMAMYHYCGQQYIYRTQDIFELSFEDKVDNRMNNVLSTKNNMINTWPSLGPGGLTKVNSVSPKPKEISIPRFHFRDCAFMFSFSSTK